MDEPRSTPWHLTIRFLMESGKNPQVSGRCRKAGMSTSILRKRHDETLTSEAIFSISVRKALVDVLGDSAAASLSYHLSLGTEDVEPGTVKKRLGEVLGDGASILERAIVVEFLRELKLPVLATSMFEPSQDAFSSSFDFERIVRAGMQIRAESEKSGVANGYD